MIAAETQGLRFTYGGGDRPALDGIDLTLRAGEAVLLEGPSGGGKSTLLRALCGLVPHFHGGRFDGRVVVGGLDTRGASARRIARTAGLVFQDPEGQAVLGSVARDVAFGLESAAVPAERIPGRVDEALAAAGAAHLRDREIATLSSGERQRVALAAVLAARPALLLLDEPTSQLDDEAAATLAATLARLADEGRTVVIGEHRPERVAALAGRRIALRDGRLVVPADDPPAAPARRAGTPGPVLLEAHALTAGHRGRPVLRDLALELAAGTITALGGPNGSGKTTLLRALAGLHRPEAGRIVLMGRDVGALPAERRFPSLGLVGQDPGRHLLTERVADELAPALARCGLGAQERRSRIAETLERFALDDLAERHPLDLSVGQRERVALAAIMVARPRVLLLDEPTRGMDPARKAELAALLDEHARGGGAALVVTHDAGFARAVADRRLTLRDGRLAEAAAPPAPERSPQPA